MRNKLIFISTFALAYLMLASGIVYARYLSDKDLNLKDVLPEASKFESVIRNKEVLYYKAKNKDGRLIGAVFKASAEGYLGDIETLVGMLKDGTISAIKIISHNETPGLGSRVSEQEFTSQFRNIKDISRVQAITGATVSSSAVIKSVEKKAREIKEDLK